MPRAYFQPRLLPCIRAACVGLVLFSLGGCQLPLFMKKSPEPERVKNPCLVLALPASGPYAPIAAKIRRGAETGRKELAKNGVQVRLENINTEAQDWLARLSALPEMCAVVGGPLQDKAYIAARKAGLLEKRAFFAFVPTLAQGDEGRVAWRFFPSPHDQVESLVKFITDDMNIRTYGAFYPADNYGRKMAEIMEQALKKRNIPLQKASYTPGSPATWPGAAAALILPKKSDSGSAPVPQTMFEALFVPDSWKNMDMITNSLLVNGEDRLALLGTTLWEQGMAGKQVPKAEKYALAVFPGAWNKSRAPAALKGSGNDFWSALGYDFVNFGASVALGMRPEAARVTARAQQAAAAVRAMSPISWDDSGAAHQRMYLFQITPAGMSPLDPARFSQARQAASERAALRMQGWGNINPDTGEALPTHERSEPEAVSEPEAASGEEKQAPPGEARAASSHTPEEPESTSQSVQAPAATAPKPLTLPEPATGVMSDTPRPSYKLSLPVRK